MKIIEVKDTNEKIIYEYKDTAELIKLLFLKHDIEVEIQAINEQINEMLDLRNLSMESTLIPQIDQRLQLLSHRLFSLEA
jgi:type II secretory pathway component HofQ